MDNSNERLGHVRSPSLEEFAKMSSKMITPSDFKESIWADMGIFEKGGTTPPLGSPIQLGTSFERMHLTHNGSFDVEHFGYPDELNGSSSLYNPEEEHFSEVPSVSPSFPKEGKANEHHISEDEGCFPFSSGSASLAPTDAPPTASPVHPAPPIQRKVHIGFFPFAPVKVEEETPKPPNPIDSNTWLSSKEPEHQFELHIDSVKHQKCHIPTYANSMPNGQELKVVAAQEKELSDLFQFKTGYQLSDLGVRPGKDGFECNPFSNRKDPHCVTISRIKEGRPLGVRDVQMFGIFFPKRQQQRKHEYEGRIRAGNRDLMRDAVQSVGLEDHGVFKFYMRFFEKGTYLLYVKVGERLAAKPVFLNILLKGGKKSEKSVQNRKAGAEYVQRIPLLAMTRSPSIPYYTPSKLKMDSRATDEVHLRIVNMVLGRTRNESLFLQDAKFRRALLWASEVNGTSETTSWALGFYHKYILGSNMSTYPPIFHGFRSHSEAQSLIDSTPKPNFLICFGEREYTVVKSSVFHNPMQLMLQVPDMYNLQPEDYVVFKQRRTLLRLGEAHVKGSAVTMDGVIAEFTSLPSALKSDDLVFTPDMLHATVFFSTGEMVKLHFQHGSWMDKLTNVGYSTLYHYICRVQHDMPKFHFVPYSF